MKLAAATTMLWALAAAIPTLERRQNFRVTCSCENRKTGRIEGGGELCTKVKGAVLRGSQCSRLVDSTDTYLPAVFSDKACQRVYGEGFTRFCNGGPEVRPSPSSSILSG